MKELTSNHDDMDKRLAIFFGLGAFLMSALVGLLRGYTLEGFLLQGVVVLILAVLGGYVFGIWLRAAMKASAPSEDLPEGTERVTRNAETLEEGSLVIPGSTLETVVSEVPEAAPSQPVNYSFEDLAAPSATPEPAPMAELEPEGDLPPPPVPGWLK